eukprot:5442025-Pleurochrysis_carterae.AAC.1
MVSCFNEHPPVVRASPYEYTNSTLGSRKEVAGAAFAVMEQAAKHHGRPEREALVFLPQRIEGDAGASEQLAAAPSGSSHAAAHVADFTGADGEVNVSAFADIARSSCAEAARCAALRARIMDREAACESATGSTAESLLSAAGASNAHSANPKHPVATRMIERLFKEDEEAAELDGRVAGTQSEVGALVEAGAMELRVVDYFNQLTSPEVWLPARFHCLPGGTAKLLREGSRTCMSFILSRLSFCQSEGSKALANTCPTFSRSAVQRRIAFKSAFLRLPVYTLVSPGKAGSGWEATGERFLPLGRFYNGCGGSPRRDQFQPQQFAEMHARRDELPGGARQKNASPQHYLL